MAPENHGHRLDLCARRRLQWGRGRMAPENDVGADAIEHVPEASMGPGPDGPGKLRWWWSVNRDPCCFNGAGAGWPRKTIPTAWNNTEAEGFNGAGAGWPRKTMTLTWILRAERIRFNGAGAGWPRKTSPGKM